MRKPHSGIAVALGMLSILCAGSVALGATALPVYDSFEDYTDGQDMHTTANWSTNATGGSAVCQTSNVIDRTKGGTTSLADLSLDIDEASGAYTNTYSQVYVQPRLYDDTVPPAAPDATVSCAFYVNTSSEVKAYDGSAWVNLGNINTSGWVAFSVHSDYENDQWALYVSDDDVLGASQRRLNGSPMSMNAAHTGTELTEMTIEGIATLDAVAIQRDLGSVASSGSNLLVYAKELSAGQNADVACQAHGYSPIAETALGGTFGDDLFLWLANGDSVTIWDTDQHLFIRGAAAWDDSLANGLALNAAHCNPGTGLWIAKAAPGPFVMFSDYDTLTPVSKGIYGSDQGGGGMNRLAMDTPTSSHPAVNGLGINGGAGDRIYLPKRGNKMLYWQGSGWYDSGSGATLQVDSSEIFWYFKSGAGTDTWDVKDAD